MCDDPTKNNKASEKKQWNVFWNDNYLAYFVSQTPQIN